MQSASAVKTRGRGTLEGHPLRRRFGRQKVPRQDEPLDLTVLDGVASGDAGDLYDDWADRLQQRRVAKLDSTRAPSRSTVRRWTW